MFKNIGKKIVFVGTPRRSEAVARSGISMVILCLIPSVFAACGWESRERHSREISITHLETDPETGQPMWAQEYRFKRGLSDEFILRKKGYLATEKRKILKIVKPGVPSEIKLSDTKLTVILAVEILESGTVLSADVEMSCGNSQLDTVAVAAVKEWIYEPSDSKEIRFVKIEYVF